MSRGEVGRDKERRVSDGRRDKEEINLKKTYGRDRRLQNPIKKDKRSGEGGGECERKRRVRGKTINKNESKGVGVRYNTYEW